MALGGKSAAGKRTTELIKRLDSLRKDSTVVMSFRVDPRTADQIGGEAEQQGLRTSHLIKSWVLQRLNDL